MLASLPPALQAQRDLAAAPGKQGTDANALVLLAVRKFR